jgi:nucleoside-diphosphate-sugar epimerase
MKTFLVTGTKGFIGSNIANYLLSQQNQVVSIDDEYIDENWMSNLDKIFSSHTFDAVFHVGACSNTLEQDVNYMMLRNYETTKHIVRWTTSKNIPVIFSSSAANYGTNNLYPSNLYGWSKYVAEDYVIKNGGIALRYFNVYGPGEIVDGDWAAVIGLWRRQVRDNEPITIIGDGEQKRDFTHIEDIVDALYKIGLTKQSHNDAWELGTGKNYSINEVYQMFHERFGVDCVFIEDQKGNYRETLRENNDSLSRLKWKPTDRLIKYIMNL